jgi:hypothetical protein
MKLMTHLLAFLTLNRVIWFELHRFCLFRRNTDLEMSKESFRVDLQRLENFSRILPSFLHVLSLLAFY